MMLMMPISDICPWSSTLKFEKLREKKLQVHNVEGDLHVEGDHQTESGGWPSNRKWRVTLINGQKSEIQKK